MSRGTADGLEAIAEGLAFALWLGALCSLVGYATPNLSLTLVLATLGLVSWVVSQVIEALGSDEG